MSSALIGAVASARSMTPMATIAAARLADRRTPGEFFLLDRLAPEGREKTGAAVAVATAVPLAYLTLAGRKQAMARIGQTRSGLIEDADHRGRRCDRGLVNAAEKSIAGQARFITSVRMS